MLFRCGCFNKTKVFRTAGSSFLALSITAQLSVLVAADLPQDVNRDRLSDGIQNQFKDEALHQQLIEQESMNRPDVLPNVNEPADGLDIEDDPAPYCFDIKETIIEGDAGIVKPPAGYMDLNDSCVDINILKQLLEKLNASYKDKGQLTTRVYISEQDLSKGLLQLTIIPGRLERFEYADGAASDLRIITAFPMKSGDVINLRDLEQGLENFNALQSQKAEFKLYPGTKPGLTIVVIDVSSSKPWHIDLKVDNSGFDATGEYKAGSTLSFDNLFNINDRISLRGLTSSPISTRGRKYSDSADVTFSAPYKNTYFSLRAGIQHYKNTVKGVNQRYVLDGWSRYYALNAEHLLWRNQRAKLYFYSGLKSFRGKNYFEDFEIEAQRRKQTILTAGLRGKVYIGKSTMDYSLGGKFGTTLLGAGAPMKDKVDSLRSNIDNKFDALVGSLKLSMPLADSGWKYLLESAFQYSKNELPGSDQFSIGGRHDVRGFQQDNLYGDSGIYMRNSFSHALLVNKKELGSYFFGLDAGAIKEPRTRDWTKKHLIGLATGVDFKLSESASLNITYSRELIAPKEFANAEQHLYFDLLWQL